MSNPQRSKEAFATAVALLKRYVRASDDVRHPHLIAVSEVVAEFRREGQDAFEVTLDTVVLKTVSQLVQSNDATDVATGTLCLQALLEASYAFGQLPPPCALNH